MPWFAMRDLKRRNATRLALDDLAEAGLEVFTPMTQVVTTRGGRRIRREVPVIQDLLFVNAEKRDLDPWVERLPNLQYRYQQGRSIREPMTVRPDDMARFMRAVASTSSAVFFAPGELTPAMYGREIRIVGGPLDAVEGRLLSVRGMRRRRLIVEIPGFISAAVEVDPDYIQFI